MEKLRKWSDPIDPKSAERLFGRFLRHVTSSRRSSGGSDGRDSNIVSPPDKPSRREDEETATIRQFDRDRSMERFSRERVAEKGKAEGAMPDRERKSFLVELKALHRHGHVDDVLSEVERIHSLHPSDLVLHGALTDFFLDRGDLDHAIKHLFYMVDAHFENADVDAAKRCLQKVQSLEPENTRLRRFAKLLKS